MPSPIHLERRWLMDTFGCFLQYDSMSQQLVTTQFTPQSFPNLFTFVPVPAQFPHRAVLRLANSIPAAIPAARFVQINDFEIAIQNIETQKYLCSQKGSIKTSWQTNLDHWEHFTLLSQEMIIGLSLLADADLLEDSQASHLCFQQKPSHLGSCAKIAGTEIKIAENLPEIAKLAKIKPHEEIMLSFETYNEGEEKFTLKTTPKRAIILSTLAS